MHLNTCTIVGRVSAAGPKLTYAASGSPICSFVVEVDEPGPGEKVFTTWLPVRITGRYAEQASIDLEATLVIIFGVCAMLGEEKRDGLSHSSPRHKAFACLLPSSMGR